MFYFDSGKAVRRKTKYIKDAILYADGVMADNWYGIATPPSATSANAYANGEGVITSGWVYITAKDDSDGDSNWYDLVDQTVDGTTLRDIPFNYKGLTNVKLRLEEWL